MRSPKRHLAARIALVSLSNVVLLAAQSPASSPGLSNPKVVLVELFTSEGCSDCPPADELLKRIDQKHTNAGQLIVGISEHVTYWNRLGWTDPFSLDIYDLRQEAYRNRFGLDSVYTPQMVVNGSEQFVGSSGTKLSDALRKEEQQPSSIDLHIVSTSVAEGLLNVTYSVAGDFPSQGLDLIAVLADDIDNSKVPRGENSGRSLTHVAVARSMTLITRLKTPTESANVQLRMPSSYQKTQAHHVILFAQAADNGPVRGADTKAF